MTETQWPLIAALVFFQLLLVGLGYAWGWRWRGIWDEDYIRFSYRAGYDDCYRRFQLAVVQYRQRKRLEGPKR